MVDVPIISTPEDFPAFRLIGVPETVAAGPPGTRVVPSTTIADNSAVRVNPPAVKTCEANDLTGRSMLEDPIIRTPEGPKEIGVPEMVTAAPPGRRVEPASSKPVDWAVNVWPPIVKVFDEGVGARRLVLELPMNNTPDGLRETGVPEIVIGVPPGTSLEPASTKPAGLAVTVLSPIVNIAGVGVGPRRLILDPPMNKIPDGLRETGVPKIVTCALPGTILELANMKPAGLAVAVWSPILKTNDGGGDRSLASGTMLPSRKRFPEGARLIGVPEMTIPGPSGKSVVPAMTISDGFAVNIWLATVKTFGVDGMMVE